MLAVYFLSILAIASAAPQFYGDQDDIFGGEIFDTKKFWAELSTELKKLDDYMEEFSKRFPKTTSNSGIKGNEFHVVLSLPGFDEKDIIVKARQGLLMVQAVHKSDYGNQKTYLDVRNLPDFVNVNGSWTYSENILKIVFPLAHKPETTTDHSVVLSTTEVEKDREEMESEEKTDKNKDADVGLTNKDSEKATEILTNEIPRNVEATTYAVDLKEDVEFVPVRY